MRSSGAWEVWLQLELFFALGPVLKQFNGELKREKTQIWEHSPDDRIDFWFTPDPKLKPMQPEPNLEPMQRWGLELKCRTNAETHDVFNRRVYGDITRCTQQPATSQTALYVIAISHDHDDINGFNQVNAPDTRFFYTKVPREGSLPIYVIWCKFLY